MKSGLAFVLGDVTESTFGAAKCIDLRTRLALHPNLKDKEFNNSVKKTIPLFNIIFFFSKFWL